MTMKHETQPGWGMGLVVQDLPQHWVVYFEHAGEKKFVKDKARVLVPVTLPAPDLARLTAKASGRKPKLAPGMKPKPKAAVKARFKTFEDQLAFFLALFEGGFEGERFIAEERGVKGVTGKAGFKEGAIALAQSELSREAFATATPEALFDSAKKLLTTTSIVFPIEGSIPFTGLDPEGRTRALEGLKQLLHGEGEYGQRLQRFAGAVSLRDKNGEAKAVTWPFATLFGAMFDPAQCTCVKPTPFATQAVTLGLTVEKAQPVTLSGYRKFAEIATKTRELLLAAGQKPRDLMDVYSFIWRTHAEKPAVS
jgi:hypothetical protein